MKPSAPPEAQADLIQYLDGEADPELLERVEAQLNTDPQMQRDAKALQETWDLLDLLPMPAPEPTFSERTLQQLQAVLTNSEASGEPPTATPAPDAPVTPLTPAGANKPALQPTNKATAKSAKRGAPSTKKKAASNPVATAEATPDPELTTDFLTAVAEADPAPMPATKPERSTWRRVGWWTILVLMVVVGRTTMLRQNRDNREFAKNWFVLRQLQPLRAVGNMDYLQQLHHSGLFTPPSGQPNATPQTSLPQSPPPPPREKPGRKNLSNFIEQSFP